MKLRARVWLILKELNASRILFVFLWLTMSIALCSVCFAYLLKTYYVNAFYEDINHKNNYKFTAEIIGSNFSRIEELQKIGFKEIHVKTDGAIDADFCLDCLDKDINPSETTTLVTGLLTSEKYFGNKKTAYISSELASSYSLKEGDQISHIRNGNIVETYEIAGVLGSEDESYCDILLPFDTFYSSMRHNGIEIPHALEGVIIDSSDYIKMSKTADNMQITLSSDYDNGFEFIEIIESVFFVFFVLMIAFILVSFSSIYKMVIKNRMDFIDRFLLLGGKHKDVNLLYGILSVVLIFASFATAEVLIIPIRIMLKNMIFEYFKLTYLNVSNFKFSIIMLLTSVLIALFSIWTEGKQYRNLEISKTREDL